MSKTIKAISTAAVYFQAYKHYSDILESDHLIG